MCTVYRIATAFRNGHIGSLLGTKAIQHGALDELDPIRMVLCIRCFSSPPRLHEPSAELGLMGTVRSKFEQIYAKHRFQKKRREEQT